jgi:DMSO reductase anchor subunit
MDRAFSVIFFTTASGAGYGLLALLSLFTLGGYLPIDRWLGFSAFGLAFALITLGLLSSTFHLGHPERAWRAFSQWRSSWLSREGIVAVVSYLPAGLLAFGWVFLEEFYSTLAWLTIVLAVSFVYCTSMIYASLAAIPAWHNKWVTIVYLLLALYSGAALLNFLLSLFGPGLAIVTHLTIFALVVSIVAKWCYWRHVDETPADSTVGSATGLDRLGQARLLDPPHTQENYLQKEMGYRIARKHAAKLRRVALIFAFAMPLTALVLQLFVDGMAGTILAFAALVSLVPGLLVERWLFFAEAKHKVTLYYGADAV